MYHKKQKHTVSRIITGEKAKFFPPFVFGGFMPISLYRQQPGGIAMWLKRKKKAKLNIPSLKDEYARLLQDTLTDLRPLQDVAQVKPAGIRGAGVVVQAHWCAHRKAIIPLPKTVVTPRVAGSPSQFRRGAGHPGAGNAARGTQ